jgi:hypothetical protein
MLSRAKHLVSHQGTTCVSLLFIIHFQRSTQKVTSLYLRISFFNNIHRVTFIYLTSVCIILLKGNRCNTFQSRVNSNQLITRFLYLVYSCLFT